MKSTEVPSQSGAFWSAPAERSGDGALSSACPSAQLGSTGAAAAHAKAVSCCACHRTPKRAASIPRFMEGGSWSRGGVISAMRQRAFSLMELLVAVSILTLIVFALYQIFNQTQKALRGNITQVDVLESGRAAMAMIARELEQISASELGGTENFYAGLISSPPLVQLDLDEQRLLRTNVLQEVFFLSLRTNTWIGTGYRVIGAEQGGVGSLHRFSVSVNHRFLTATNLSRTYLNYSSRLTNTASAPVLSTILTNFHRVADGIIHMRVAAYDPEGRRMGFDTTNVHPHYRVLKQNIRQQQLLPNNTNNVVLRQEIANQTKLIFLGNALPAYLELEIGVLEPDTLAQYESIRVGSVTAAQEFLKKRASKVHLFRQRIPVRTAALGGKV